MLSSGLVVITG